MKKLLLALSGILFLSNLLHAQCTNSGNPQWNPVPGNNATTGTFEYPSTAAIATMSITGGTTAFSNNSGPGPNTAYMTKSANQTLTLLFNISVGKSSIGESFKLSSVGTGEGQTITATNALGATVYPTFVNVANATISGTSMNEITGTTFAGAAEYSFLVPIKTLTIAPSAGVTATSGVNVIFQTVCANATLPVELVFFNGKLSNKNVLLTWQTASERDNEGFDVERSDDAATWNLIGFVKGNGTSTVSHNYQFEDKYPLSKNYYRLRQTDFNDSKATYSKTIQLDFNGNKQLFKVYPNPVMDKKITVETEDESLVQIINAVGTVVKQQRINNAIYTFDVSDLPVGFYVMAIQNNDKMLTKKIFIAQ